MTARLLAVAVATAVLLAGCVTVGNPFGPVQWDDELDLGVPGEVTETVADVRFYPACGNEVLEWDGSHWYPYSPETLDEFPVPSFAAGDSTFEVETMSLAVAELPAPGAAAVAAPGPGDDVGTLVIYEGGIAYWVSESGELSTWLTETPLEYPWVC